MNEKLKQKIQYLRLPALIQNWDDYLELAEKKQFSYDKFLRYIIDQIYCARIHRAKLSRMKMAKIPDMRVIETFPFSNQPKLPKKRLLNIYDSLSYMTKHQNLIFIGATGIGKSGLATSFLVHAINNGYTGRFFDFTELIENLGQGIAGGTYKRLIKALIKYDIIVIDEMGYIEADINQVGLFFRIMRARDKKKTTIITTNLGFGEWSSFLKNDHLSSALIDRLTANCHVFNMKNCKSLRSNEIDPQ